MIMDIKELQGLFKVEESDTDVFIYLGHKCVISMSEDEGMWFPTVFNYELMTIDGYKTKQAALDAAIKYLYL